MKSLIMILVAVFITAASSVAFSAVSESVDPSWTAPGFRADGVALAKTEIAGYRIYVDEVGNPANSIVIDINDPLAESHTFEFTTAGDFTLKMTTIDTDGRESAFSNIVPFPIGSPPNPPGSVSVTTTVTVIIKR